MTLVVGHIAYTNCAPFFHHLRAAGFRGDIVPGVPAQLNRLLAAGEIDVSPCSSFEYGRNWREYLLLPNLSISTRGPVRSVLLFSPRPLAELEGANIALTGESASSVHLLKILLHEFVGLRQVGYAVPEKPVEEIVARGGNALLIGDRALKTAQGYAGGVIYDLGELWQQYTGLPFVFALWILRRQAALEKPASVAELLQLLQASQQRAFADLAALARAVPEGQWMSEAALVDYWQTMSYTLDQEHLRGLELFFHLCQKHRLLPDTPQLQFFSPAHADQAQAFAPETVSHCR
jgi:chorismate dehydratase